MATTTDVYVVILDENDVPGAKLAHEDVRNNSNHQLKRWLECRGLSRNGVRRDLIEIWFEPTDIKKASKPFQSGRWKNLKFVSPNFNELKMMSKAAGLPVNMELTTAGSHVETLLEECAALGTRLVAQGNGTTVIVTLGSLGVMVVQRGLANEPFYIDRKLISHKQVEVTARFYPVKRETSVVNVSGAGDCFASGFILAMLQGKTETECISCGLAASLQALRSVSAVPNKLTAMNGSPVPYKNML